MVRRLTCGTVPAEISAGEHRRDDRSCAWQADSGVSVSLSSAAKTYSKHLGLRCKPSNGAAHTVSQQWSASSALAISTATRWLSYQGER